jgi:trehalose synthase
MPQEIHISSRDPEQFQTVLSPEQIDELRQGVEDARTVLAGRCVWNINSTAKGGGVVELLRPLVAYARGAGVDARWLAIDGTPEFFELTKRIHNHLHGANGDGGPLDERARRLYEDVLAENLAGVESRIRSTDVVIVHDPQPAGLVPALRALGATVIWRCHVGVDQPNDLVREAWSFLLPYVAHAHAYVFSRAAFVWDGIDRDRVVIIPPTIDAFTPKNQELEPEKIRAVLIASRILVDGEAVDPVTFERQDGTPGRIERQATLVEDEPLRLGDEIVVQVSRWDALKDPIGVIRGFGEYVAPVTDAHLLYVGPSVEAVADDPEGARTLRKSIEERARLREEARRRVHLATLPMDDLDENAIMVNAVQRYASVIAQKSLAEGFGLTVAEAMWKGRPVVASRVGGIQEQIVHGESGILLDDPHDLAQFGAEISGLLADPDRAERLGRAARERVRDKFLSVRSLLDYLELIRSLLRQR